MNFVLERNSAGVDLVLTGKWSKAAEVCIADGRADGLILNYARGFGERNLDFVQGLPLRRLDVLARTLTDVTPVYSLGASLRALHIQSDPLAEIELDRLPELRELSADWGQIRRSLRFVSHLERLFIQSYSELDLAPLADLSSLASVVLKDYPQLRSLDGVEGLRRLEVLAVHLGRDLEDISALGRSPWPVLTALQLPSCRGVADISPVASCVALRFFELSEGSEIPTVAPLAGLKRLERLYLYGSTKVADGDLGPIAALPRLSDFRMRNRRGYAPSVQMIQDEIVRRGPIESGRDTTPTTGT